MQRTLIATPWPTVQNATPKVSAKERTGDHHGDDLHSARHPASPRHCRGGAVQPLANDATRTGDATNRQGKTTAHTAKHLGSAIHILTCPRQSATGTGSSKDGN